MEGKAEWRDLQAASPGSIIFKWIWGNKSVVDEKVAVLKCWQVRNIKSNAS